jgi:hypothetical protein
MTKQEKIRIVITILIVLCFILGLIGFSNYRKSERLKKEAVKECEKLSKEISKQTFSQKAEKYSEVGKKDRTSRLVLNDAVYTKLLNFESQTLTDTLLKGLGLKMEEMTDVEKQAFIDLETNLKERICRGYRVDAESIEVADDEVTVKVVYRGIGPINGIDVIGTVDEANSELEGYVSANNDALMDSIDATGKDAMRASLREHEITLIFNDLNTKIEKMPQKDLKVVYTLKRDKNKGKSFWYFKGMNIK